VHTVNARFKGFRTNSSVLSYNSLVDMSYMFTSSVVYIVHRPFYRKIMFVLFFFVRSVLQISFKLI
jgi:hypothetical protein